MTDKQTQATTAFEEGKALFLNGEYESSANKLGEACQLFDELNGVLDPANGDVYFQYGEALLQHAIKQNTVLGQQASNNAATIEEQTNKVESSEVQSDNPLIQLNDAPQFVNEDEEEVEEAEEAEEEEEEDDFETAWDILDVARVIYEKSEDKETRLKLADVHLCLGDISLETEKFNDALTDYKKAIDLKQELLEEEDRQLAEAHYKYALALELSSDRTEEAVPELRKAIDVLKKRLALLKETDHKREIDEINEIIPDMELKIEELNTRQASEKEAEELLKSLLGIQSNPSSTTTHLPANDLNTLIKRKTETANDLSNLIKRKKEGEDASTKRAKLE
ncbi:hypothetical protein BDB01DRAFT_525430 [Pilobolus umbonatus]|nr:hypothetical protein BDB01DRAFT_525430 [Pilobolus umbonatus]